MALFIDAINFLDFFSSVLQSLHNIREFSCFFSTLPSMETKPKRPYYSRSNKVNFDEVFLVEELRKVRALLDFLNISEIKLLLTFRFC